MPKCIASGSPHAEKAYFSREMSLFSFLSEHINLGTFMMPLAINGINCHTSLGCFWGSCHVNECIFTT
uniref:Uncharacterized protein n=1 Tax=mine drainage metagenome TaxID=410659 RepID=E6QW02_9ZZZZ